MFRVNQRVICVDASPDYTGCPTVLRERAIYTVEAIIGKDLRGNLGLVIEGAYSWHPKKCYRSTRFRPIVERKTDIAIFKRLLNPSPDEVKIQVIADKLADIYLDGR